MTAIDIAAIALLILLLGAQYYLRPLLVSNKKTILAWLVIIYLGIFFLETRNKFLAFQSSPGFSGYLVPPYQPINYLFFTVFIQFILPVLISFSASLLLYAWTRSIAPERRAAIFEPDEPFLAALSVFLVGHPGWLIYLGIMIGFGGGLALYSHLKKSRRRISLYKFWLPVAILTTLVWPWLKEVPFVKVLRLM